MASAPDDDRNRPPGALRRAPAGEDDTHRAPRTAPTTDGTWIALGVLGLFFVGAFVVIPPWLLFGIVEEIWPALLVGAGGVWTLVRALRNRWTGRRVDMLAIGDFEVGMLDVSVGRPPRRRPRGGTRRQGFVTLAPSTNGAPFDPLAPKHQQFEALLRTCRTRDGLVLDMAGRRVCAALDTQDGSYVPLAERVVQWRQVSAFLSARDDVEATWWTAVACAERDEMETARRALSELGPRHLAAAVRGIEARGAWVARAAAAIVLGDADAIDRAISSASAGQIDVLAELMDARWAAMPDPRLFVRWATRLTTAEALMRARLPDVAMARWTVLLESPSLDVATLACRTVIDDESPDAVMACRVLLARRDLLDRPWSSAPRIRPLERIVEAALAHLGACGEAADVPRLKAWRAIPRFEFEAGESLQALAEWVSDDLAVGGLTLTVDEGAAGGLSRPQERGGLSIDEPD